MSVRGMLGYALWCVVTYVLALIKRCKTFYRRLTGQEVWLGELPFCRRASYSWRGRSFDCFVHGVEPPPSDLESQVTLITDEDGHEVNALLSPSHTLTHPLQVDSFSDPDRLRTVVVYNGWGRIVKFA